MTANQKRQILDMRRQGLPYAEIAGAIGLPKNTVKTFCWRNRNLAVSEETKDRCKQCGKPLEQRPKQKPRRFCDDACRFAWWKDHRDNLNRKAVYTINCAYCGNTFDSYGNKSRKFCCHKCYIADRFGESNQKVVAAI